MGNGMSFKAGRDMPPGMQEKLALQLLADLQKENGVPDADSAKAAVNRKILDDMKKKTIPMGCSNVITTAEIKQNDEWTDWCRRLIKTGCPAFGESVRCREDQVQEAKRLLLEQAVDMLRTLAQNDEFWVIHKNPYVTDPQNVEVCYTFVIPSLGAYLLGENTEEGS